ncbi:MAG TPA: hypothetical protein VFF28_06900 [Candidatus Nanoarchaeia archaeon]|nr:hypothetical protein [Candidatus Nanoarchaeia archaeon]
MSKKITKERCNFTIDSKLVFRFREYCKENCINMSAKIEKFIEEELDGAK